MTRTHWILALIALLAAAATGGAAWWFGVQRGMAMMATPEAIGVASADPSRWTIPQGEAATRRHIRDGLKAGDLDPVTDMRILNYHDPMVPGKNFDAPAKSPFMDMMLVPRYAGAAGADTGSIVVSPRIQQNLGFRTAPAIRGALTSEVNAVGAVAWNEREQVQVSARAFGYVDKLYVRAALDRVIAGAPLVDLHIPSWVAAQEEYLALARMTGPDLEPLRDAARARLRQAGMSETQVAQFEQDGAIQARMTLTAPVTGIVSELQVREGATVMSGMPLLKLQGTSTVWAEGQVPEAQAALLRSGAPVSITSPAVPGQTFNGRVQVLLPEVDPATRTRRARLELANGSGALVPGMTVQMRFERPMRHGMLLVPTESVIYTGRRSVVLVAEGEGRFRSVDVRTGLESGDQTEILQGLQAGQRVVLSGQFLIDSEGSLRGLEARLNRDTGATTPTTPTLHRTEARIASVDGDSVALDHPPIASLKWPQMTMDFRLPPPEQRPRGLAAGERVRIEFRMQEGDVPQIVTLQRLAPAAPEGPR